MVEEFVEEEYFVFICGYYEGYDEWICEYFVMDEVLIGDYILIGGEIGVMIVMDSVIWFLLGVFGNKDFVVIDFFLIGLFEYLYYMWLVDFRGMKVLDILFSGNYVWIEEWCDKELFKRIYECCLDLFKNYFLIDK